MFDRLRKRICCYSTFFVGLVLFISFSVIYFVNKNIVYDQNERNLLNVTRNNLMSPPHDIHNLGYSMIVNVDEVISFDSLIDSSDNFYEDIYELIKLESSLLSNIDYSGNKYIYYTTPLRDGEANIIFIDVTQSINGLTTLLNTLFCLYIFLVILVYMVSKYISVYVVKPIEMSYKKQKRFIEDASHELKTPISVISANVDVLLSSNKDNDATKWLNYIKGEALSMSKLITNMLDMASNNTVNLEKVNVSDYLREILNPFELIIVNNDKLLDLNIDDDVFFNVDKVMFREMVCILIDNAIKYSFDDTSISVKLFCDSKNVVFCVKNHGEVISNSDKKYIFDRFYKVDKSRSSKSYGIGLSILKKYCDLLNYVVSVSSNDENGTEFKIIMKN